MIVVWAHRSQAREALAVVEKMQRAGHNCVWRDTRNYAGAVEKGCRLAITNNDAVAAAHEARGIQVEPLDTRAVWCTDPDRWATETVYIIGGGPSAGKHDLTKLRGVVVAVNDSGRMLPDADVMFTADLHWVQRRLPLINSFLGDVVVAMPLHVNRYLAQCRAVPPRCHRVPRRFDHNSGEECLYWVADMGARRVVLVGFDLARPSHWHGGYDWVHRPAMSPEVQYPKWVKDFANAAREMKARGVEVLNANPQSAIQSFPFTKLGVPRIRKRRK